MFFSGESTLKAAKTDETSAVQSYPVAGTETFDTSAYTATSAYAASIPYTNSYTAAAAVAATAAAYGYANQAQTQWPGYTATQSVSYMHIIFVLSYFLLFFLYSKSLYKGHPEFSE